MDSSTDDYFGTLGGTLMKDLLADLQVDDNDWSLEQLEKELETMVQEPSLEQQPLPSLNAASLIVSHGQDRSSSLLSMLSPGASSAPLPPPGMGGPGGSDAWSLSLQKFTSLSLQDDFLAADSARKQTRPPPPPGLASLVGAEDYDVKEKPTIAPPPGLGGGMASPPPALPIPVETTNIEPVVGLSSPPPLPTKPHPPPNAIPMAAPFMNNPNPMPPPQGTMMPPMQRGMPMPGMAMPPPGQFMSPPGRIPPNQGGPPPMGIPMQMPIPMNMHPPMGPPVTAPLTGVVVASAVSTPGPAWQTPRPPVPLQVPPPQPPKKAFCNPFPGAPPIPATALESSCMKGRDIAYVVHAILKPVLAAGTSENDYYIQYLKRRIGNNAPVDPMNPKRIKEADHDVASRQTKSKEWASEKSVLGHVTKSNVARPRALIATPKLSADQENKEQRQRANLWKARVYCDQAYQSYQKVIDIWRAAPSNNGIPPQVQIPLAKLMKCMGIVLDNETKVYTVSDEALQLILKLEKGRTLICRVLEQALLPPNAVQALLPSLLGAVIALPTNSEAGSIVEEKSVGRLFQAITGIIPKLPIHADTLVKCLEVAMNHGKWATCSIVRMGCMHSLLQKGAQVVPQDPSDDVKGAWGNAERKFMSILQGA